MMYVTYTIDGQLLHGWLTLDSKSMKLQLVKDINDLTDVKVFTYHLCREVNPLSFSFMYKREMYDLLDFNFTPVDDLTKRFEAYYKDKSRQCPSASTFLQTLMMDIHVAFRMKIRPKVKSRKKCQSLDPVDTDFIPVDTRYPLVKWMNKVTLMPKDYSKFESIGYVDFSTDDLYNKVVKNEIQLVSLKT